MDRRMMKEGYAGADHMRFQVANSFAWEVMRPGSVGNDNWDEMKRVLIDDKLQLGLKTGSIKTIRSPSKMPWQPC